MAGLAWPPDLGHVICIMDTLKLSFKIGAFVMLL